MMAGGAIGMPDDTGRRDRPHPRGLRVECHAGYRGEETPRRFQLGSSTVEVQEILDRWLAPDHRYFKVRGEDGDLYILRHAVSLDDWELTLYRSRTLEESLRPHREL
jgi:hypothetical protein